MRLDFKSRRAEAGGELGEDTLHLVAGVDGADKQMRVLARMPCCSEQATILIE